MTYENAPLLAKALTQGTFLLAGFGLGTILSRLTDLLI